METKGFLRVGIIKAIVDELTFQDLALLEKIGENTVVDGQGASSLGSRINSSFFDAANMLGTLKQKGLIEFKSQFPAATEVEITTKGKNLMAEAEERGRQEMDKIDEIILSHIANGYKEPKHIRDKMNLRETDLAFHLKRIVAQNYASYVFRSGRIEFSLTDQGFGKAGYPAPASEEEVRKSGDEVAEIMGAKPAPRIEAPPQKQGAVPFRLDKDAMRKAKMEYYAAQLPRYALIALVALVLLGAAALYLIFMHQW